MPRKNLTARFVESVTVETRQDYWDDMLRGLVFRVTPLGVKTWNVVYTREPHNIKVRHTIGRFPAMTLDKARATALTALASIANGGDPAGAKKARLESMTMHELGQLFIEKYSKPKKRSWQADERILKVDVYPLIGRLKAGSIKRRELLDVIEAKTEEGFNSQARAVLAVLRKTFNWAVQNDYVPINPLAGVSPVAKPARRERVLSDAEVHTVWNALPKAAVSEATAEVLRLLFLTGQRSGEVAGMTRGEVDLHAAIWTIDSARVKNKLQHNVPLSEPALEIIARRLANADEGKDAPLFARVGKPIESNAVAQATRKALQMLEKPWTPHDIRRTVATGMGEAGVFPHIVEAVLNHISGAKAGVAGIYNHAAYDKEKRRALDLWADRLQAIVGDTPSNIVQIKRGA